MKEIFVISRPDYKSIQMETRCGNPIENHQVYDFSATELNTIQELDKGYKDACRRNKPNPIYNCHGMTFACGRTQVDNVSIPKIIDDDGYTKVEYKDVCPGDVVIYYDDSDEAIHSGIVACVKKVDKEGKIKVPWVVSKWGKYSEVYHHELNCPYANYERRYWRITR